MPTLSVVRTDFKKLLKWGAIALAGIIALFIIFKIIMFVKNIILPPPPPKPTLLFGTLKKQEFPEGINREFTYEVDTISGDFPEFKNIANVFKMEQRGPDILAVDNASNKVVALGFNKKPEQLSDFVYKWTGPSPLNRTLTQDIRLNKFQVASSYMTQEEKLNANKFETREEAIAYAKSFLERNEMLPEDLDDEKTKVDFLILENGTIKPSSRIVTSNIATVYFFQKPIEEIPIVYPQSPNSSMRFLVGKLDSKNGVVLDANFAYQKILTEEASTYPIKTAEEAYEDLKKGQGKVIAYNGNEKNIKIKNIYLAYYNAGQLQNYLMPVIVFEGNDGFIAYIPAIPDEWIDK